MRGRNSRTLGVLALTAALGLVLGGTVGAWAAAEGARQREAARQARWVMVPVLAADRLIPAGARLDYHMLRESMIPAQFVSPSLVRSADVQAMVGERVMVSIRAGDPIYWGYLLSSAPPELCDWMKEGVPEGTPPAEGGPQVRAPSPGDPKTHPESPGGPQVRAPSADAPPGA